MDPTTTFGAVRDVVVATLGIDESAHTLQSSTPMLGSMPELDSMAVVELVTALEARFELHFDDSEITGEVFETMGSLVNFVDSHRS